MMVNLQATAQARAAEPDEVIERFATYRSDEPFVVAVLPRRARYGRVIPDSHRTNCHGTNTDGCTLDRTRRRGRESGHGASSQGKASVTCPPILEQFEGDGASHEQIDGRDPGGMIAEERLPTLEGGLVFWSCTAPRLIG